VTSDERYQAWFLAGLRRRGVPDDARISARLVHEGLGEAMEIVVKWDAPDGVPRVARQSSRFYVLRRGWHGWPAYHASARLLRSLG
jgi:hypothetical protein